MDAHESLIVRSEKPLFECERSKIWVGTYRAIVTKVKGAKNGAESQVIIKDIVPSKALAAESYFAEELWSRMLAPRKIAMRLLHAETGPDRVTFVFEKAQCDLLQLIERKDVPFLTRVKYFTQLVTKVGRMHAECQVAHMDLSLENVVIDKLGQVRLIDFAQADRFDPTQIHHVNLGNNKRYDGKTLGKPSYLDRNELTYKPWNAFARDIRCVGLIGVYLMTQFFLWGPPKNGVPDRNYVYMEQHGLEVLIRDMCKATGSTFENPIPKDAAIEGVFWRVIRLCSQFIQGKVKTLSKTLCVGLVQE